MTERSPDLKNEEEADSSALYRLPLQRPQLSRESQKHRWTDWGARGRYYWPLSGRRQAALMGFLGCSRWEKLKRGRVEHIHSAARRKEILHSSELRTAVVTEFVVGEQRQQTILSGPVETGKNKATSSSHYLIRFAELRKRYKTSWRSEHSGHWLSFLPIEISLNEEKHMRTSCSCFLSWHCIVVPLCRMYLVLIINSGIYLAAAWK